MKVEELKVLNPNAAGIDVGSKSHYVAVGQGIEQVKEFSVYSSGLKDLIFYLKHNGIRTVAMESTGSYWQTLFSILNEHHFEVLLVSGYKTKNLRAKTDVKDCQWIQKLHSLGLLQGCYLPGEITSKLRNLHRHRQNLVSDCSRQINRMQKALRLMNLRLDVVINDIMGVSGQKIIVAILAGERDSEKLAALANNRVRKSKAEIADALHGLWNTELLHELEDCYEIYKLMHHKILQCDKDLEHLLRETTNEIYFDPKTKLAKKQLKGKNQPAINLPELSYRLFDVDLFSIPAISSSTVITFIAEIGLDINKFPTAKHFTSWLRLAPNNKISGGKVLSSRTPKGKNKFTLALRNAANTIERQKSGMMLQFFKRIAFKKGRAAAITATARKLAVIIWNMIMKKEAYNPIAEEEYNLQMREKKVASIKKMMAKLDITTISLSTI